MCEVLKYCKVSLSNIFILH